MTLCVCVFVCELIKEQIRVKLNISYAHLRQEVTWRVQMLPLDGERT